MLAWLGQEVIGFAEGVLKKNGLLYFMEFRPVLSSAIDNIRVCGLQWIPMLSQMKRLLAVEKLMMPVWWGFVSRCLFWW